MSLFGFRRFVTSLIFCAIKILKMIFLPIPHRPQNSGQVCLADNWLPQTPSVLLTAAQLGRISLHSETFGAVVAAKENAWMHFSANQMKTCVYAVHNMRKKKQHFTRSLRVLYRSSQMHLQLMFRYFHFFIIWNGLFIGTSFKVIGYFTKQCRMTFYYIHVSTRRARV